MTAPRLVSSLGSLARAIADGRPECAHLSAATVDRVAFAALNTAFLEDGAFIVIPANVVLADPIHVVVINGGAGRTMAHPRTLVVAGAEQPGADRADVSRRGG